MEDIYKVKSEIYQNVLSEAVWFNQTFVCDSGQGKYEHYKTIAYVQFQQVITMIEILMEITQYLF